MEPTHGAVRGWIEGWRLLLDVPIRTQFDGSEYQAANCGPASLAMVLEAFGVSTRTFQVRNLANRVQGTYELDQGIALDHLAWIAAQAGLRPIGLVGPGGYQRWTYDEIRQEVRRGRPVITLVKLRDLPDHASSRSEADHYIVAVGLEEEAILFNDPAMPADLGFRRPLTRAQLEQAWEWSSIPGHAVAFAATESVRELDLPDPASIPRPAPLPLDSALFLPGADPFPPPESGPDAPLGYRIDPDHAESIPFLPWREVHALAERKGAVTELVVAAEELRRTEGTAQHDAAIAESWTEQSPALGTPIGELAPPVIGSVPVSPDDRTTAPAMPWWLVLSLAAVGWCGRFASAPAKIRSLAP